MGTERVRGAVWVGVNAARLEIEFSELSGNSVALRLEKDAQAVVRNCLIEGIPSADRGFGCALVTGGNTSVIAEKNLIRGLEVGIQLQRGASLELRTSIIENIYDDGIEGTPEVGRVRIEKNAIYKCGRAGIAMAADGDQKVSLNLVVETGGINPQPSAISIYGARADAAVRKNTLYGNIVADSSLDHDVPREKFWRARRPWTRTYRNAPVGVDGRHKFHESAFLTRYGRWLN